MADSWPIEKIDIWKLLNMQNFAATVLGRDSREERKQTEKEEIRGNANLHLQCLIPNDRVCVRPLSTTVMYVCVFKVGKLRDDELPSRSEQRMSELARGCAVLLFSIHLSTLEYSDTDLSFTRLLLPAF